MASSSTPSSAPAAPVTSPAPTPASPGPLRAIEILLAHLVVAVVALVVIGGATRVMEAGLACPDWPLCYGVLLPGGRMNLQVFLEWFHRLDAFLVGVTLFVLCGFALHHRRTLPAWLPAACLGALLLVAFQGALGALTVIRLLEASTVTAHLGTALALLLLLSFSHRRLRGLVSSGRSAAAPPPVPPPWWWRGLVILAGLALMVQCLLGGSMASQWAADRCFSAGEACRWLGLHRLGAWPAAVAVLTLAPASRLSGAVRPAGRGLALGAGLLVLAQVALGVFTLRLQLASPSVTVAHQMVAALLVAVLGSSLGEAFPGAPRPASSPSPSPHTLEVVHG